MPAGKLYLCPTPIGNLEDITLRVINTLRSVDLIAAEDTRHTIKLLNHLGISTPMTSYYEHNKKQKGNFLIQQLNEGKSIALVSDAGTPAISDPGEDLVALCIENRIGVEALPGCTALITALTVSGLPTGRFAFEGFLSINKRNRMAHLEELKEDTRTLIFYEAPHKLTSTLKDMLSVFGDRQITLARELTKKFEEIDRTTLKSACEKYEEVTPKGEFVLVIKGYENQVSNTEVDDELIKKMLTERILEQGEPNRDAIKNIAAELNIQKRRVYSIYTTINKNNGGN